jgi:hypothetical protein
MQWCGLRALPCPATRSCCGNACGSIDKARGCTAHSRGGNTGTTTGADIGRRNACGHGEPASTTMARLSSDHGICTIQLILGSENAKRCLSHVGCVAGPV